MTAILSTKRLIRAYSTALDAKWVSRWTKNPLRKPSNTAVNPSYMCLSMFPYPSGALHMGHLRVYTISDVLARYRRMNNYSVIHAMGWDAFGLPAENAAIEHGVKPSDWTYKNIDRMKQQMTRMLADFDWDREVITCSPEYYKWTQKLFLMMYEAGLAYRKQAEVNWDPVDKTVLANEQVDSEGKSWRSGAKVEKKLLDQWFLGITKYADRLLKDLNLLDEWPQKVLSMQKNWIGQSKGTEIQFHTKTGQNSIKVFTTRPDTLFGVSYVAISLDHPLTIEYASHDKNLANFIKDAKQLPEGSKAGFRVPRLFVSNPLTPNTFDIPVYVAPYVLGHYGSGAVMGCPRHDIRDSEFWEQNGDKPALKVIDGSESSEESVFIGKNGTLNDNCGIYAGLSCKEGGKKISEDLISKGLAKSATQIRLRDWLISRQRFWGAPIPIVHCKNCGTVPVPDDQLPVRLPEDNTKPLAQNKEFLETTCPKCHGPATRDSDTMDTFMDSSWYFFRYCDSKNTEMMFDYSKVSNSMPVDVYIGGIEHAILHLLYSRFISKFLADSGAWSGGNMSGEPIKKLVSQGMVQGKTFINPDNGAFLKPSELKKSENGSIVMNNDKAPLVSFEKMSKSKFNGVDPEGVIERHGADATRAHILFQGPVEDAVNWDEDRIVGIERWLNRFQSIVDDVCKEYKEIMKEHEEFTLGWSPSELSDQDKADYNDIQDRIASITGALHDEMTLNTLISDYMKFTHLVKSLVSRDQTPLAFKMYSVRLLARLIAPVVPSNAEEAWEKLEMVQDCEWSTVFSQDWPKSQSKLALTEFIDYSVILNGKKVCAIKSEKMDDFDLEKKALNETKVQEILKGNAISKIMIPKGRNVIIIVAKPQK